MTSATAFALTVEARAVRAGAGLFSVTTTLRTASDLRFGRFLDRIDGLVTMKDVNTIATAIIREQPSAPLSEVRAVAALTFETLAEENIDFVFRCLRRCGLDEAAADDAVQQVFLIASTKLDVIQRGKEKAFLYGVAKNVAADARRKSARRQEVELVTNADDDESAPMFDAPSADEMIDRERARALLDEVLATLPEKLRDVFVLSEIEELSATEVAACLDIPVGTVASRLAKARETFDAQLTRIKARHDFDTRGTR
jgi:RNA polymerase sigma-70 factor (ECF subfamily)